MSVLSIVCGGQTGVDQGAAHGAIRVRMKVEGYRPAVTRKQTEDGKMPSTLLKALKPVEFGGYAERTIANVHLADALLVLVPDRLRPRATAGTALTLDKARRAGLQILVSDGQPAEWNTIDGWLSRIAPVFEKPFRLMVAGPRASSWPEGFGVADATIRRLFEQQTKIPGV